MSALERNSSSVQRVKALFSKLMAYGLLVAVLAAVWSVSGAPLLAERQQLEGEAARLIGLKERYAAIAARRDAAAERLGLAQQDSTLLDRLLTEPGSAEAAASMHADVEEIVVRVGGVVRQIRVLPAKEELGFERVGLSVLCVVDSAGLRELLTELEIERSLYRIDDLRIKALRGAARRATNIALDLLTVQFELIGYRPLQDGEEPQ